MRDSDFAPLDRTLYFKVFDAMQDPTKLAEAHERVDQEEGFSLIENGEEVTYNFTHNREINIRGLIAIEFLKDEGLDQALYSTIMTRFIAMGRFIQSPEGEKVALGAMVQQGESVLNPAVPLTAAQFPVDQATMTFLKDDSYDAFIAEMRVIAQEFGIMMPN